MYIIILFLYLYGKCIIKYTCNVCTYKYIYKYISIHIYIYTFINIFICTYITYIFVYTFFFIILQFESLSENKRIII